uniref:DNase I-like protein n=1 Tax=Mycena chlorophos TaxID=658473 RepID=A0ABQ0LG09_MYCCL|nr:predicted protein [Mycena chlorophos]
MPIQPNELEGTDASGCPGTRDSFGESVPPLDEHGLQLVGPERCSSSKSRVDSGSSPGFPQLDPADSQFTGARLAIGQREQPIASASARPDSNSPWLTPVATLGSDLAMTSSARADGPPDSSRVQSGVGDGEAESSRSEGRKRAFTEIEQDAGNVPKRRAVSNVARNDIEVYDWESENLEIQRKNKGPPRIKSNKNTRAALWTASLNMQGRQASHWLGGDNHKFSFIKREIDENNIGILAVQETHMDSAAEADCQRFYQRWFM